jgi:hypothetical protein
MPCNFGKSSKLASVSSIDWVVRTTKAICG